MSRWLSYAEMKTPPNHPTNPTLCNPRPDYQATNATIGGQTVGNVGWLGEVLETVPGSGRAPKSAPVLAYSSDDDELAFAAIAGGDRTYGAVATTTRMGATRAFQATERLKATGYIQQAKDGTITFARDRT